LAPTFSFHVSLIVCAIFILPISSAAMSERGAVITGAASGMGLALTKDLLAKGWRVVMADINPAGEELAVSLGDQALFVKTDISDFHSQMHLFRKGPRYIPLPMTTHVNVEQHSSGQHPPSSSLTPASPAPIPASFRVSARLLQTCHKGQHSRQST